MERVFINVLCNLHFSDVKADDTKAVNAVLEADVKRLELLQSLKKLEEEDNKEAYNKERTEKIKQVRLKLVKGQKGW